MSLPTKLNYGEHQSAVPATAHTSSLPNNWCDTMPHRLTVLRLAGMVGPGLRKNPVYDILQGEPLRIHPESQYQFLHAEDAAHSWDLARSGGVFEAFESSAVRD